VQTVLGPVVGRLDGRVQKEQQKPSAIVLHADAVEQPLVIRASEAALP